MLIQLKLRYLELFIQKKLTNWSKKHLSQIDLKGVKMTYVDFQNTSDQFFWKIQSSKFFGLGVINDLRTGRPAGRFTFQGFFSPK